MLFYLIEPIPEFLLLFFMVNTFYAFYYSLILVCSRYRWWGFELLAADYDLLLERLEIVGVRSLDLGLFGSFLGFAYAWGAFDTGGQQAELLAKGLASGVNTSILGMGTKIGLGFVLVWLARPMALSTAK